MLGSAVSVFADVRCAVCCDVRGEGVQCDVGGKGVQCDVRGEGVQSGEGCGCAV